MVNYRIGILGKLAEAEYLKRQCELHRKKFAQVFTPYEIASFMLDWVLQKEPANMLEPAFGLGAFSRVCIEEYQKTPEITGCELDPEIHKIAEELFQPFTNVKIDNADYIFHDWDTKYDAIVCNPPYLKFHDYDNKQVLGEIERRTGYKFGLSSNLYTMFIIKAIYQLSNGGRASFIVPTEFLNSNYGVAIKRFLLDTKVLRYIFVVDYNALAFSKVLTTSSILLLQNDASAESVFITKITDANQLKDYKGFISTAQNTGTKSFHNFRNLNPKDKWSIYYNPANAQKLSRLLPFSQFAQVKRGIATGDNDYFTFSASKALEHNIPQACLLPCISKAIHAPHKIFTASDFEELKRKEKRVFLFDGNQLCADAVAEYLTLGIAQGVNQKYLTSKRKPWYKLENRPPSDLWIGVFNRNSPRFILNEAKVRNLTAYHSVYLNNLDETSRLLFIAYLLSDAAIHLLEKNNREYGNGLKKLEPNDINHSLVLDVNSITKNSKELVLNYIKRYIKGAQKAEADAELLQKISEVFFNEFEMDS
ncbi:MAG: N-6 DNA methylase [Candidatus Cloacimonetes bacterium]|nr:N-6 DNA methylase [Candidatus Cloacimonadota bacterium]